MWNGITRILLVVFLIAPSVLAEDGPRIRYAPLSDAAKTSGCLDRYAQASSDRRTIELSGHRLTVHVPEVVRAYDVVPLAFELRQVTGTSSVAMVATAFDDRARCRGRALYDMSIPGNSRVEIEYLGHVSASFTGEGFVPLTADPHAPISAYPNFQREELLCSSAIKPCDLAWFKFRITNVGDTILDPEGFGSMVADPHLLKLKDDGQVEWDARPLNLMCRHLEYVYPGESLEHWVSFYSPAFGHAARGLQTGEYKIVYSLRGRFYDTFDRYTNIWWGTEFAKLEVPLSVTANPTVMPIKSTFTMHDTTGRMPGYFSDFEEFMTSFKIFPALSEAAVTADTLHVQVAPWTEDIVIKMITQHPREIAVVRVPIRVDDSSLAIEYNPRNTAVITDAEGHEKPAFFAQLMPAMRVARLTPYPEQDLLRFAQEAKDLGVDVVINTAGDWWAQDLCGQGGPHNFLGNDYKYFFDVVVRQVGFKLLGWSVLGPCQPPIYQKAESLLERKIEYVPSANAWGSPNGAVDICDPAVVEVLAAWTFYQYERWGDLWYQTRDGRVPIDVEDTWGWLREYENRRYALGSLGLARFRTWLRDKYGTIVAVNQAWGSSYADFAEIDPQKDQGREVIAGAEKPYFYYNKEDHVFHNWSRAIEDFDLFRSQLKVDVYRTLLKRLREKIPAAELNLRTEGTHFVAPGEAQSDNLHLRQIYYGQRKNADIFEVMKDQDAIKYFSSYTTMPYSVELWRQAHRQMVEAGLIPNYLPTFDRMRDMVANRYVGVDHTMDFNYDEPTRVIEVYRLLAAYPYWKAAYEEGGMPCVIWSDYTCEGFMTETQKRELRLLTEHFQKMAPR